MMKMMKSSAVSSRRFDKLLCALSTAASVTLVYLLLAMCGSVYFLVYACNLDFKRFLVVF